MKRSLTAVVSLSALLLLVGAGCSTDTTNPTNTYNSPTPDGANNYAPTTPANPSTSSDQTGDFTITAEPTGNGAVSVKLNISEETKKDAEGYRLLLGKDANPTMENRTTWYELGPAHMEKMWGNLPMGMRHIRVCVVKNKVCSAYSNNVQVEIK